MNHENALVENKRRKKSKITLTHLYSEHEKEVQSLIPNQQSQKQNEHEPHS